MEDRKGVISAIRNPLSIIALCLMLVEVAMTVALRAKILTESQRMWIVIFCTLFPVVVFLSFYILVWIKPQNLYGPSDYDNQKDYLDSLKIKKIQDEVQAIERTSPPGAPEKTDKEELTYLVIRAHTLAFNKLRQEFGPNNIKEFTLNSKFRYDGIILNRRKRIVFEVKYLRKNASVPEIVSRVKSFASDKEIIDDRLIAIVTDTPISVLNQELIKHQISEICPNIFFRFYSLV